MRYQQRGAALDDGGLGSTQLARRSGSSNSTRGGNIHSHLATWGLGGAGNLTGRARAPSHHSLPPHPRPLTPLVNTLSLLQLLLSQAPALKCSHLSKTRSNTSS